MPHSVENQANSAAIAPWLSVSNTKRALEFYKSAFGAVEVYKLESDEGIIARLSVNGAEFWVGNDSTGNKVQVLGGNNIRMIIITTDPDALFRRALKAGATEIYPISEAHGWRIGRISDPFGLHWEIGKELTKS